MPSVRASTQNSAAGASINVPTNVNGDMLVWFVCTLISAPTTPTGWNLAGTHTKAVDPIILAIYTRVASSEPASYTLTASNGTLGMVMVSVQAASSNLTPDSVVFTDGQSTSASVPATSGLSSSSDLLLGCYHYGNGSTTCTIAENGSLVLDQNHTYLNGTNYGCWVGHLALAVNSSSAQAATLTITGTTPDWIGAAVALAPVLGGFRPFPRLPQVQRYHRFENPRHVRIYHPKPAQYETLLVPVRVRPRPQVYPKKWKLPAGWRSRDKFKGRLWHWPQEFMTLLVPVKPRPIPFRTKAHWRWATDARQNVLKHLKRPASFFAAAALPKFRTRPHWKWATGWRERLKFPVKYRPAEFMTLFVPVKPRPVPFKTRIHWKLPWPLDLKWNPLHRPRASAFSTGAFNIEVPKRYRARWRPKALLDRVRLPRRLSASALFGGLVRRYRVPRILSRPQRPRLVHRLGTQAQAATVLGGLRPIRRLRYAAIVARRVRNYRRLRASAELLVVGIRHRTKLHSNSSISNYGSAVVVAATVFFDIARWRFQRRNIDSQGRVRSSSKHGDV